MMKQLNSTENKLIKDVVAFSILHHDHENFHHELENKFNVMSMNTGGGIEVTPIRVNEDTIIAISNDSVYLYSVDNGKEMSDEEIFQDEKAIENAVLLTDFSEEVVIDMKRDDGKIKFSGTYNGIKFSGEFEMEGDTMNDKFNKIESEFEANSDHSIDSPSLMIIRAKLLDELKKMGFDFEGNHPKFYSGGTTSVIVKPRKAFKKGGKVYSESDFKEGQPVLWLQFPEYKIYRKGFVTEKITFKGPSGRQKGIEYTVYGAGDPMGDVRWDIPDWKDVKPLSLANSEEIKNISSGYKKGGMIQSITSFLNKKVTLEDFTI